MRRNQVDKLIQNVLKHKKIVIIIFVALAIAGALLITRVSVNYDMSDYLPKDAQSTAAISIIKKEFTDDTPTQESC